MSLQPHSPAYRLALTIVLVVLGAGAGFELWGQTCYASGQALVSVPLSAVPLGGETHRRLGGEGGARLGVECGEKWSLGADVELDYTHLRRFVIIMVETGPHVTFAEGDGAVWIHPAVQGGAFFGSQTDMTVLPPEGELIRYADDGPTFGGRLRFGVPIASRWSLVLDASLRVLFVETNRFPDPSGTEAEIRLPLAAGFRLQL